jgi:hypothetical protein
MRENIDLSKCAKVSFQTLLLKPTKVAAAAVAVLSVALHAAVWAPGGPPELPGYEQLSAGVSENEEPHLIVSIVASVQCHYTRF